MILKEDVAAIMSEKTGMPMTSISEDEGEISSMPSPAQPDNTSCAIKT